MAGKNIKGINLEIGGSTTKFNKAMKDMSSVTRATQKELDAVNKSLKFDPKNVDLLKQKEELLAKQIEDVRIKVDKMKEAKAKADKEMAKGTEVNQEQYRILVREISAAEGHLKSLEKQNKEIRKSTNETGKFFVNAGKSILATTGAAVGMGTAATAAMAAAAEGTREYREDMNKLETAFKTGGFTVDAAKKSYEGFYAVLGETDRSVEAVNHLARFVTTEQELAKWSDIAAGVTATFGDSLPIEGLTEAANETVKVGQVTGVLADALNWAGINEDKFNENLKKCNSEKERSELITSTLDDAYKDAATTYKELNADIIANRKATSESNDQMAKLGASSESVNTKLKDVKSTITAAVLPMIGKLADKISGLSEEQIILLGGIGAVVTAAPKVITTLSSTATGIQELKGVYDKLTASIKAMNVAQKASFPIIGAITVGATLLIGAVTALASATDEETKKAKELHEANMKRYEDYKKLKESAQEQAEASLSEMSHIGKLKDELMLLADESGRVADSDKARAEFILGQLNGALGTEYTMTGNIIRNCQNLSAEIDNLITKKKAEILLSSKEDTYKTAVQNIEDFSASLKKSASAYEEAKKEYEDYAKSIENSDATGKQAELEKSKLKGLRVILENKKEAYDKDLETYNGYLEDIKDYENTQISILKDGGKEVVAELENRTTVLTEEQKKAGKSYSDAVVKLADYTEKYKQGVEGYTQAGIDELKAKVETTKAEAEKIGVSINEGMVVGLGNDTELKTAVSKLCENVPQWAKKLLGINSPAKVAIPLGEAIPQGIGVGITKDMSAEEALEKKCSNLKKILSDFSTGFKADIELAESEYNLWLSNNPNASGTEKASRQRSMYQTMLAGHQQNVQNINDVLWHQEQLTGTDSTEYKQMLADLNKAKAELNEIEDTLVKSELVPKFSQANVDLAESHLILWKAQNPDATEFEKLLQEEKKLNVEYEEQGKKVQDLNDELYLQIQLTGEESEESKKLLTQLNEQKAAYEQLAAQIRNVNEQKAQYIGTEGISGSSGTRSAASAYAAYHVQYGAMLKSQGVSQEAIDATARKVSGYSGERSINVNNYISGTTPDTAYKVGRETAKQMDNFAMQGVL